MQLDVCIIVLSPVGGEHDGNIEIGLWVLTGLLTFMTIEKIFPEGGEDEDSGDQTYNASIHVIVFWSFNIK